MEIWESDIPIIWCSTKTIVPLSFHHAIDAQCQTIFIDKNSSLQKPDGLGIMKQFALHYVTYIIPRSPAGTMVSETQLKRARVGFDFRLNLMLLAS